MLRHLHILLVRTMFMGACGLSVMAAQAEDAPASQDGSAGDVPPGVQTADVPRVGGLDAYQQAQLQLAEESPAHEVVWLEARYPERDQAFRVLALQQQPRAPQVQGAVIVLHDLEQHADWPYLIRPLRQALPEEGWYTLAVNLPKASVDTAPERTRPPKQYEELILTPALQSALQGAATGQQNESDPDLPGEVESETESADAKAPVNASGEVQQTANEAENVDIDLEEKAQPELPPVPYSERAQAHLKAALAHIDQLGYQNIILVAYRAGANTALSYIQPLAASMPASGFALVMIDPELEAAYQVDLATAFGKQFKPPVLDVYNSIALPAREQAARRASQARMAEMANYRQIKLNIRESGGFQDMIIRRVRSWMMTQAPGMSATKMRDRRP